VAAILMISLTRVPENIFVQKIRGQDIP